MSCTVLLQCCLITPKGWDVNSDFIVVDVNKGWPWHLCTARQPSGMGAVACNSDLITSTVNEFLNCQHRLDPTSSNTWIFL